MQWFDDNFYISELLETALLLLLLYIILHF